MKMAGNNTVNCRLSHIVEESLYFKTFSADSNLLPNVVF